MRLIDNQHVGIAFKRDRTHKTKILKKMKRTCVGPFGFRLVCGKVLHSMSETRNTITCVLSTLQASINQLVPLSDKKIEKSDQIGMNQNTNHTHTHSDTNKKV